MGRRKRSKSSESSGSDSQQSSSGESDSDTESSDAAEKKTKEDHQKKQKSKLRHSHKRKKLAKKQKSKNLITKQDFFEKSSEFRLWLTEKKHQYFDEMSNDESRKLFKKFVQRWNSGKLNKKYYKGIPVSELQKTVRTRYKWKFASKLDDFKQDTVRDSVMTWTAGSSKDEQLGSPISKTAVKQSNVRGQIGPIGPTMPPSQTVKSRSDVVLEKEEKQVTEQRRRKYEDKKFREHKNIVIDELLPKATGREARIEKKFAEAETRRQKEHSPETRDDVLMGGGDNFKSKLAARQRHHERRREEKKQQVSSRIEQYEAKERATMEALLTMAQASKKEGALWQPK